VFFALTIGNPISQRTSRLSKWLLQACVVLLGFSMDLPAVLRLGLHGSLFAAVTIGATLLLGRWLGRRLRLGSCTSLLIAAGTAICGGSAIAAVGSVIAASEAEIAVSIGTVFLLNAMALFMFPAVGHLLHLSQQQFGLWAGVGIHDISSVVGAGLIYGRDALQTAVAVKLSRSLWIVPLAGAVALNLARKGPGGLQNRGSLRNSIPWFIGLFLLASLLRSYVPGVAKGAPQAAQVARGGMVLVLFLIGTSLSLGALKSVGWRTALNGLLLWLFVSAGSLAAIRFLGLAP
jgi:uncharacterized integral membrane protein (TIGR00698 family)